MSRVQLALNVSNTDEAVGFCSKLFGAEPATRRPGHANFAIVDPPLKLVLIENTADRGRGTVAALNHLGAEVGSSTEVLAASSRLTAPGLSPDLEPRGATGAGPRLLGLERTPE
jgi:hypothetical protein